MYEPKVNLIIALPGRVLISEHECSRKVRKPLMGKGKKSDKQVIDKNGNPVWHTVVEPDPAKTDILKIDVTEGNGKTTTITVHTRKAYPAQQRLSICKEAYEDFISTSVPEAFHAPKGFQPPTIPSVKGKKRFLYIGKSLKEQAWLEMSPTQRLEWHLRGICAAMGGVLDSYKVFDD